MSIPTSLNPLGTFTGTGYPLDMYPTQGNYTHSVSSGWAWEHENNSNIHWTTDDRSKFSYIKNVFFPENPPTPIPYPAGALDPELVKSYLSTHAQLEPSIRVAPGKVYVSRVPYARVTSGGTIVNQESKLDPAQHPNQIKLLDNQNLRHTCWTDNPEGGSFDDYDGKWAFFWQRCNYIRDAYGVKWISAIEGETIDGKVFDPALPTGVFGPPIWAFCKVDTKYNTTDGEPNFQLWGIGDRPWHNDTDLGMAGLSDEKIHSLSLLGVEETDYHLWSTAKYYTGSEWKPRPYILDSAYCGTAICNSSGTITGISSVINQPPANNLSYDSLNNLRKNQTTDHNAIGDGGVRAQALGIIFDIVKNADKNSQNIHAGMCNNNDSGVKCNTGTNTGLRTKSAGYIFPIASTNNNFELGMTVYMRTASVTSSTTNPPMYTKNNKCLIGRIVAIEERDVELVDYDTESPSYSTVRLKCLVFDENITPAFYVCNGSTNAEAQTNAEALIAADTSGNTYACAFACRGASLAGETYVGVGPNGTGVVGKHDGAIYRYDFTDNYGKRPYRVQGMEFMCGYYQMAMDCMAVKGDGSTSVTLTNGQTVTPTTSEYLYLYAPPNVVHKNSGSINEFLHPTGGGSGYIPIGVSPYTMNQYVFNGFVDTVWGVWYPVLLGASTNTGHGDYIYTNGQTYGVYRSGGYLNLNPPAYAGSGLLTLNNGPGLVYWNYGARD